MQGQSWVGEVCSFCHLSASFLLFQGGQNSELMRKVIKARTFETQVTIKAQFTLKVGNFKTCSNNRTAKGHTEITNEWQVLAGVGVTKMSSHCSVSLRGSLGRPGYRWTCAYQTPCAVWELLQPRQGWGSRWEDSLREVSHMPQSPCPPWGDMWWGRGSKPSRAPGQHFPLISMVPVCA